MATVELFLSGPRRASVAFAGVIAVLGLSGCAGSTDTSTVTSGTSEPLTPTPTVSAAPSPRQTPVRPVQPPLTRVAERIKFGSKSETAFSKIAYSEADSTVWLTLGQSSALDPYSSGLVKVFVSPDAEDPTDGELWIVKGFKEEGFPDLYHVTPVQDGEFLFLVFGQTADIPDGGNILVFDVFRSESMGRLPGTAWIGSGQPVYNSRNNLYYYPMSCDVGTVNTITFQAGKTVDTSCGITGLFLSTDGRELMVRLDTGVIEIHDSTSFKPLRTIQAREFFTPIATKGDNSIIVGIDNETGEILELDAFSGEVVKSVEVCDSLYDAVASPDVTYLYATCKEGLVVTYEGESLTRINEIPVNGEPREIVLNQDGNLGFVVTNRLEILTQ